MSSLLTALLFAAAASAQITTTFWAPAERVGGDKLGFYGSVINVNGSQTTLALVYDNGTITKIPGHPREQNTVVIGPTVWQDTDHIIGPLTASPPDGRTLSCELKTPTNTQAGATCTATWSPMIASRICDGGDHPYQTYAPGTYTVTRTHTFSERRTATVAIETVTRTIAIPTDRVDFRKWCSARTNSPSAGFTVTRTFDRKDIHTYQVVITAGLDKLSATQGASGTLESIVSTASGGLPVTTGIAAVSQAAAPMVTVGPRIIGLGVAIAALAL